MTLFNSLNHHQNTHFICFFNRSLFDILTYERDIVLYLEFMIPLQCVHTVFSCWVYYKYTISGGDPTVLENILDMSSNINNEYFQNSYEMITITNPGSNIRKKPIVIGLITIRITIVLTNTILISRFTIFFFLTWHADKGVDSDLLLFF